MKCTVMALASSLASAQVTGPTTMRGRMSRAFGPPAASAAASATDGTPASASTRLDHVAPRAEAISSASCSTKTSLSPRAAAAAAIPGLFALAC